MIIQHNIAALNSHRNLTINNNMTAKNLEKLSSGYRINRAGDDAAGLAISEKMRGQIRGLSMAEQNAKNGISLIQTAEGGLQEVHSILQRMRELAVQSSNGTYKNEVDRENLDLEFQSLKSEIDRISEYTNYNGIKLLNGELSGQTGKLADLGLTKADLGLTSITFTKDGATSDWGKEVIGIEAFKVDAQGNAAVTIKTSDGLSWTAKGLMDAATGAIDFKFDGTGGSDPADRIDMTITLDIAKAPVQKGFSMTNITFATQDAYAAGDEANALISINEGNLIFQIGANGAPDQRVHLNVVDMRSDKLGAYTLNASTNTPEVNAAAARVSTQKITFREDADAAIEVLDNAINMVSTQRAGLGSLQNRLEYTLNNLGVTKENLTSAESVIRDVDMAKEMMEFTKNQILVQASQAMLAQANQLPQGVLNLLR